MVDAFARIRQNAGLNQIDHPVGNKFGMDAEVFLVQQVLEHRIRNGPDSELHGRAIRDQAGNMGCNPFDHILVDIVTHSHFCQRAIQRNDIVHAVDVHQGIAQSARHLLVNLGDDDFGNFRRRNGQAGFGPHRTESMLVRR